MEINGAETKNRLKSLYSLKSRQYGLRVENHWFKESATPGYCCYSGAALSVSGLPNAVVPVSRFVLIHPIPHIPHYIPHTPETPINTGLPSVLVRDEGKF